MYDPGDHAERDPAIREFMRWFDEDHLSGDARSTAYTCRKFAEQMVDELPDSTMLIIGLRKFVEVKDCLVRATLTTND